MPPGCCMVANLAFWASRFGSFALEPHKMSQLVKDTANNVKTQDTKEPHRS